MPNYNVEYFIPLESARDSARREIAKIAARITDDNGVPLYDLVKSYKNDTFIVDGFVGDSLRQVLTRFPDVCRLEKEYDSYTLAFYIPDFDYNMSDIAEDELKRFVCLQVTALWLATRYNAFAQFYTEQASASMERLVVILRTRKTPERCE
jgi:hypothetical protein